MLHRFGYQVLLAVFLGIFAGIFLGPYASLFKPIADIFMMLLQMVVLPYVLISIVHGLGSIAPPIAWDLFKKGWPFWVFLWATAFAVIYLLYYLLPKPLYGSFLPDGVHEEGKTLTRDILSYLVPQNPFYDMVNNVVPAIAVFGIIAGSALMHLKQKDPLLGCLDRSLRLIEKILHWIAAISPVGVFAHLAIVTGTVNFEDLYKLEFYVVCFTIASFFLALVILPAILTSFTPLSPSEALKAVRSVCLLPLITGLPTIALPFLGMYLRKIERAFHLPDQDSRNISETVVPIAYAFAQIGNAFLLFFVFFLSFYYRHPFSGYEKVVLSLLTIPLSIGSSANSINAVSFLIERLGMPPEAIEIFTQTMGVTLHFQVFLSMAGVLVFSLLVLFSFYRLVQCNPRRLLIRTAVPLMAFVVLILGIKPFVNLTDNYKDLYMNLSLDDVLENRVEAVIYYPGDELPPLDSARLSLDPLERVLQTGVLRVGYHPEVIPYCYFNEKKDLVGYDIAMACQLARDLDCRLDLIPMNIDRIIEELEEGRYDIAMSAIVMSEERIRKLDFSRYYAEEDNVLIIPVKMKSQFKHLLKVVEKKDLRIGATGAFKTVLRRHFPLAQEVEGTLSTLVEGKADAWVWSHVSAFIWCLNHPEFTVADYNGLIGKIYFSYPVRMGANDFLTFLDNWLDLKEQSGFLQEQRGYWILGDPPERLVQKRWSIMRNVLHWVK